LGPRDLLLNRSQANGHIGKIFVRALIKNDQHEITALTRAKTKGPLFEGISHIQVDFSNQDSLVAALQGQEFLIITLAVTVGPEVHDNIVYAAASAGVPYVMPNFYGSDIRNPNLGDEPFGAVIKHQLGEMERLDVSYVSLACGTWYEWSVALGESWFGFTIPERKVTFFDDGETRVNVSTWPQCGRAVAALLSLPVTGASPCVADWKNEPLYITSFRVSQREILNSLHRVLGTTDENWQITYEPTAKRAKDGMQEFSNGIVTGIGKAMYAKLFICSRAAELELPRGMANKALGLPEESLDEATRTAVEMVQSGWNPLARG
jgi:hypothetical protein